MIRVTEDETRLKQFIIDLTWTFAKTYANTDPHEYLVYDNLNAKRKRDSECWGQEIYALDLDFP